MFAPLSVKQSFIRLGVCLLISCLPLIAMAQMPFVSQEEALNSLEASLAISSTQRDAFIEAMQKVYVLRERFRVQVAQAAGGRGVELETLMAMSEQLQSDSEALLRGVLSSEQLAKFRESSGRPISIAN
ncbi:MAG: hypothetical protein R3332_07500 [Pseudohongiellaceae bacterium]|nr:hypothetical protein [Pseudohongiellaceae bacterium]